jgi:hypothetical protein
MADRCILLKKKRNKGIHTLAIVVITATSALALIDSLVLAAEGFESATSFPIVWNS